MKKFPLAILLLLFNTNIYSQITIYMNDPQPLHEVCEASFEDSAPQEYGNNEDYTLTFQAPKGKGLHVYFADFTLHSTDTLKIYDGETTNAPLIGAYTNKDLAFITVHSSFENTSSALCFHFKSDAQDVDLGWVANVNCTKQCQTITPSINPESPTTLEENSYFNLCEGETLEFTAKNIFPENDMYYHQSDDNVSYLWEMGDGTTYTGNTISHTYQQAKGYNISVMITDTNNCKSNKKYFLAKVSKLTLPDRIDLAPICSNSPQLITIGTNPTYDVVFPEVSFETDAMTLPQYVDSLFLPDKKESEGNICGELTSTYKASIHYSEFPDGAVLENYEDIRSICINIEHSHMSTIDIKVHCPNGKNVALLREESTLQLQMLGEPYGTKQADGTFDISDAYSHDHPAYICDESKNPAGVGYTYCFASANDTEYNPIYLDDNYSQSSDYFQPLDSTNRKDQEYYYKPQQIGSNFKALEGCPLNGKWYLEITDEHGMHNGYLFSWDIEFSQDLLPMDIQYTNTIENIEINGNNSSELNDVTDTSFIIIPTTSGNNQYNITAYDNAGCMDQTTIDVLVFDGPAIEMADSIKFCPGEEFRIDNPNLMADSYLWNTGETSHSITATSEGMYTLTATIFHDTTECASSDSTYAYTQICELGIPTVITPNNDGVNDFLYFKHLEDIGSVTLSVYNRWGNVIYQSTDYKNNWYPSEIPTGTYYFIMEFNNQKLEAINGSFSILK